MSKFEEIIKSKKSEQISSRNSVMKLFSFMTIKNIISFEVGKPWQK